MPATAAQLIADFCRLAGDLPVDRVAQGAPFKIEGVSFSLGVDEERPDMLLLYAEFGEEPRERRAEAYARLLQHAYLIFEQGASFGISPLTDRIVYLQRMPAEQHTAESILDQCAYLSEKAREWRQTRFLEEAAAA